MTGSATFHECPGYSPSPWLGGVHLRPFAWTPGLAVMTGCGAVIEGWEHMSPCTPAYASQHHICNTEGSWCPQASVQQAQQSCSGL